MRFCQNAKKLQSFLGKIKLIIGINNHAPSGSAISQRLDAVNKIIPQ
ncbi:hypothetical protein FDUTEX481_07337 [Tolypothrix sp. PCC 7601]|nr:hypothetical protein FDUTEX481_07337 [Tolypothrix sp. PCC 7601]